MNSAKQRFINAIAHTKSLSQLHTHVTATYALPHDPDDLNRTKVVWSVSAFDKLIHDLIRLGMVQTFMGQRSPTPKYLSEPVPLSTIVNTYTVAVMAAAITFEQVVFGKLKHLSFQDPQKLTDGLSLIWPEKHKWTVMAADMGLSEADARTTLSLIASRRNAIVHESDLDPITLIKTPLDAQTSDNVVSYIERLGHAICNRII